MSCIWPGSPCCACGERRELLGQFRDLRLFRLYVGSGFLVRGVYLCGRAHPFLQSGLVDLDFGLLLRYLRGEGVYFVCAGRGGCYRGLDAT